MVNALVGGKIADTDKKQVVCLVGTERQDVGQGIFVPDRERSGVFVEFSVEIIWYCHRFFNERGIGGVKGRKVVERCGDLIIALFDPVLQIVVVKPDHKIGGILW